MSILGDYHTTSIQFVAGSPQTEVEVKPQTSHGSGNPNKRVRHYVHLDENNENPANLTVCGELWDQLHVPHNGDVCQKCIDELKSRGHG